ncbi:RDD family protein [Actinomadura hibisca]|uniref:RDD family protein n=1 Tax=Actinomadura hibisca TaxID=68565 RepID=UPI00082C0ECC|nr:RDD family protein [Actinomadura hibisca]
MGGAAYAAPGAVEQVLAEPGQRLVARIVDTLVVGLPVVMALRAAVPDATVEAALAPPLVAAALLLYETVQLALWGRTLGKRFAGIEVVRAAPRKGPAGPGEPEGPPTPDPARRPGFVRSLARTAVYTLPIAVRPVPVVSLVAAVFWVVNAGAILEGLRAKGEPARGRRQAVHDRLADTLVIKRPAG